MSEPTWLEKSLKEEGIKNLVDDDGGHGETEVPDRSWQCADLKLINPLRKGFGEQVASSNAGWDPLGASSFAIQYNALTVLQ